MQRLQDSVFSLTKTTNLSPAVFSFLQPDDDFGDKTPLGGILQDTKHGWLALGHKFCIVDLRTGLKVAARTFGTTLSNNTIVTSVVELPTPLTPSSQQLLISLQYDDISVICVFHINGSQILRCIQTDIVVTQLSVCDKMPDGPFSCFDGVVMAGTNKGEVFVFDLNRAGLIQALKYISQGYEHLIQNETNPSEISFLPLNSIHRLDEQRELALENEHHLAVHLNENSVIDGQYIFRNPDGSVRMKAKRDHVRVTVVQYIPQLGSLAVGFNFGAFQIWNLMNLSLEFTSQVNVECLPVTHFGFQEPCDDPRAFCYLWVVFSVIDRYEEEEFPLAVLYSLTYQGKRMLSDNECLYQDFLTSTVRFQIELSAVDDAPLLGGKCIACHTYSIKSTLGDEGEDSMLNLCQLVWECWGENANAPMEYGMLLFDLDQWYKDQMPASYRVSSNAFMSAARWSGSSALHARLAPDTLHVYSHATRLEEHFYPNSLQYDCICLNTSEVCVLSTMGIQRQLISSMEDVGPTVLLNPPRLYNACVACGLTPLYTDVYTNNQDDQRRYLLSVALEARLSRFLKRCAHDWATGTHSGVGCTLTFLVDWCWKRAIELKENAKDLTAPLFVSSALPDRNVVRCLDHCVQQLTQLTGLMDAILTKCCNLVVPDALSEMEEKHKGIGTVSLYFQVVQWLLRVGLLPERHEGYNALPYPALQLYETYNKRRLKLNRLQENSNADDNQKSCSLLYIDQLIEHEFGGERIHKMWMKGGSECGGLYPPPSLYSLLRLYLLPEIAEEHKHSLVLYLLVDYSMIYDDVRYEAVIRRLMQFPTMFGLSNTAIKATQAFWHLDHRDFDFALDQLQCLTGNSLSEWQHNVVLSSLLAQKKTQAALQYLHVRKPAPIQNVKDENFPKINDHDKLEDWQSCCNLYLARGLVFEALDVVRMCVQNATGNSKTEVLNFFFKGCRNTGNLCKILQVSLQPFEEQVFIKYLEDCNEPQTSDILIMYFLQQARYLEAERYNERMKSTTSKVDTSRSLESLANCNSRGAARDHIVVAAARALPRIAEDVARAATMTLDLPNHVTAPKPMSVYIRAKSPKNSFTYKSSFIQDTIENASETWINRPKMRKGIKRALNIEETPFICTPKLNRTRSIFSEDIQSDSTPPKRPKLDLTGTPKTPKIASFRVSEKISSQMEKLLDMPEVQSPIRMYPDRPETPHSILKIRRNERDDAPSPADSRYLGDSDDEMLETASNHTHYSDSTNKHLRFTIPTTSECGSTPSPIQNQQTKERERSISAGEKEMDASTDSFATTTSHGVTEAQQLDSPTKKMATEETVKTKKTYKDNVRARHSLSISANSSLSEDLNASIESIADIPITLINVRHSHTMDKSRSGKETADVTVEKEREVDRLEVPKTPKSRKGIRSLGESTPLRNSSITPERQDSPITTPLRRLSRSRSKTPEVSPRSSPLPPIIEQPKQELESEPHPHKTLLSVPRQRSRSRTPDRIDKVVKESPKLEAIKESPTKTSSSESSTSSRTRSLRSRSRTPEVETTPEPIRSSPRSLRNRSKTPEKLMSPIKEQTRGKKSLSRLVLEANTFAKTKQTSENIDTDEKSQSNIECTPMKTLKQVPSLMDVTLSPITNKSVLVTSDSTITEDKDQMETSEVNLKPLPAFTTLHETYFEKSVLVSYESSVIDSTEETKDEKAFKSLPAFTINEELTKSVLHSYESSVAEQSLDQSKKEAKSFASIPTDFQTSVLRGHTSSVASEKSSLITNDSDDEMAAQKEKEKIVEIQREINEIEGDMSNDSEENRSESGVQTDETDNTTSEDNTTSSSPESDDERDDEVISIGDSDEEHDNIEVVGEDPPYEQNELKELANDPLNQESDPLNDVTNPLGQVTDPMGQITDTLGQVTNPLDQVAKPLDQVIDPSNKNQQDDNNDQLQKPIAKETDKQTDQPELNQVSLLTDDNSESELEINLNYSDENIQLEIKEADKEAEKEAVVTEAVIKETVEEPQKITEDTNPKEPITTDIVDFKQNEPEAIMAQHSETKITEIEQEKSVEKPQVTVDSKMVETVEPLVVNVKVAKTSDTEKVAVEVKLAETTTPATKKTIEKQSKDSEPTDVTKTDTMEIDTAVPVETEKPGTRPRRRAASKSKEIEPKEPESPKTPRKRTHSNASTQSNTSEPKTPEEPKRRGKTPEMRKIITRRISREMAEKLDESNTSLDESLKLTPKRTRSKNDDNQSVASESSFVSNKSNRSRASEESDKPRKGRRTTVTKPDLSVIPEVIAEESKDSMQDVIGEYSGSRRLTRNQKAVLESWLQPSPRRRASTSSRVSAISENDEVPPVFDVQPIDRISLLNKTDFEGAPDNDELSNLSTDESIASDASRMRKRLTRAASETKTVKKAAKISRRGVSVDIVVEDPSSPALSVVESPVRSRRASFNRACEALQTPKGRRASTDIKNIDSPAGSPSVSEAEAVTPSRRPRRASTQSNNSATIQDTPRRSKKMPTLEEIKKKK